MATGKSTAGRRWRAATFAARFWARVNKNGAGGCWLWTGCITTSGYGTASLNGKAIMAHRISWELTNGPIPKGERYAKDEICVLHRCDVRRCVNAESHLFLGTQRDNMRDMRQKRRGPFGSASHFSKLTDESVRLIWSKTADGMSGRKIASELNVSPQTVSGVLRGHNWKHIQP